MADWKDMITGTLGVLRDKARELRESDAVDQVRRKLDEATEGTVVRSVYEQGAARTRIYARIAKLSLGVNGQTEELKKVYAEIGKLYFEQAKDSPEGIFAPLFGQAETLIASIKADAAQIEELKAQVEEQRSAGDIDVEITQEPEDEIADFERIVDQTETDGKNEEP